MGIDAFRFFHPQGVFRKQGLPVHDVDFVAFPGEFIPGLLGVVNAGDDLIGRRDSGHADVGAVYVGRVVEHVLENALFDQYGSPAVAEVRGVRRGRYHPGASFPQNHLQPADCYVVGLFGDQSHAAAVVDGYVFDQYTGRGGRVDRRRMPVLGEDAFECQDRSDGR